MKIYDIEQGTPEWRQIRCGKITASMMDAVMAKGRSGGESKTRRNYMLRLIAERLSGIPQDTYSNAAMEWGVMTEPTARLRYELENYTNLRQVGFIESSEFVGCSPDGLVDDALPEKCGLVEIKCPNTSTHIEYILNDKMPAEYVLQVQAQLWICQRNWCDFVSFDPRIPCRDFWKIRVFRDEKKIAEIQSAVEQFIEELLELEGRIKNYVRN